VNLITRTQLIKRICSRCLFTAALLFSACTVFAQSKSSQAPPASSAISVQTDLVVLPVSVTDSKGSAVLGLTEQNFQVYEDGRLQKLALFQQGDTPITVGLLVDHSRSMGPELPEVADAVSSFAQSGNPHDEMFVVDFNDDVSVELLNGKFFTDDPKELARAVSSVRAWGRTALYDAVAEGLLHLQLGHYERKALIIISDGGDNASQQKFAQVLALAQKTQVVIYSIGLISDDGEVNPGVLRHFSKATGGIAYFPDRTNTVTSLSTQIARDLREQYTLGFAPEKANNAHAFRKIEVKVSAPGKGKLRARTRTGYSAAEDKPAGAQSAKAAQ
jgi:Ca-activated chloride channel family protein